MITSKHIKPITLVLVCICLIACIFIVYAANAFDTTNITEYQKKLFGDEVITLDIQVNQEDWQELLNNSQAKEWISGDLIINGERFSTVGIRTKGNSSLSMVASSDSDRYSLQFKFNKYVKGQSYYGLDTFCINNISGDATYMKDYLSYEIMDYIGVPTPLTNYASVSVNGEDYGFLLALERYDQAFLDRVYNTSAGQLYNVKMQMGMRGNAEDMPQDETEDIPQSRTKDMIPMMQDDIDFSDGMPNGDMGGGGMRGFGGFGGGSGGGSLVYTDDDTSSYSSIFDNAVSKKTSDTEKKRVVAALKNLNEGTDLEKCFNVDEILRYLAAHTVVVNLDSYSSNMAQNYYIYERDGKISILPWDYSLAFGGFQSGTASSVVNFPIDTPVSGVTMEERPLINKLLEVEEYREKYHAYLQQIVEGYFESGIYESTICSLDEKINDYVKSDVSAFFTYAQYESSLPQLIELGALRAESIRGQLDTTIPSTTEEQNKNSSTLIDASAINLSALGSMGGGAGMGPGNLQGGQGEPPNGQQAGELDDGFSRQDGMPQNGGFGMQIDGMDSELMRQAMQILMNSGGNLTGEVKEALIELGINEEQISMLSEMQNRIPTENGKQDGFADRGVRGNIPEGMREGTVQTGIDIGYALTVGILLLFLIGAIVFIARPKKNSV